MLSWTIFILLICLVSLECIRFRQWSIRVNPSLNYPSSDRITIWIASVHDLTTSARRWPSFLSGPLRLGSFPLYKSNELDSQKNVSWTADIHVNDIVCIFQGNIQTPIISQNTASIRKGHYFQDKEKSFHYHSECRDTKYKQCGIIVRDRKVGFYNKPKRQ